MLVSEYFTVFWCHFTTLSLICYQAFTVFFCNTFSDYVGCCFSQKYILVPLMKYPGYPSVYCETGSLEKNFVHLRKVEPRHSICPRHE